MKDRKGLETLQKMNRGRFLKANLGAMIGASLLVAQAASPNWDLKHGGKLNLAQSVAAADFLTSESLAMPRRQIALNGTDLRLFNARSSLTFRERTVTGIGELFIAPRAASRVPISFNLSFREESLGALIEDNQDEWGEGTLNVWQHWNPANKELGIYKGWGYALILPSQRATWAPDAYTRRGTFHHYLGKDLISFGVISRTLPAADVDGAYEELTITNRTDRPPLAHPHPRPTSRR